MVAMQRRGTNVVVGGDRQKLGAKELDVSAVVKRNRKQITSVLASLTVFAVLLSESAAPVHSPTIRDLPVVALLHASLLLQACCHVGQQPTMWEQVLV